MEKVIVNVDEKIGDGLISKKGQWNFNDAAVGFDDHVQKSIPAYALGHNFIIELATFFLEEKSLIYEIGCSTGTLCKKFLEYHNGKNFKYIGIDNVPEMISIAKHNLKDFKNTEFVLTDSSTFNYKECHLFISYYTLQFIKPGHRTLIGKIF